MLSPLGLSEMTFWNLVPVMNSCLAALETSSSGLGLAPTQTLYLVVKGSTQYTWWDWTLHIDSVGEIVIAGENSPEFYGPASGRIVLADGSELTFQAIVRIEW